MIDPNATVFLVDDETAVTQSIERLLRSINLKVETFSDTAAFLAHYQANMPGCAVVEMRMSGIDGMELHARLKQANLSLPVIFLTEHGDVPTAVRAIKAGAVDFLQKPFDTQRLLDSINEALRIDQDARAGSRTQSDFADSMASLTAREREITNLVLGGARSKDIARILGISPKTVEVHRSRVMKKLSVRTYAELAHLAGRANIARS